MNQTPHAHPEHVAQYRAHVARSALTADPLDPNDYPWQDMPWLECPPALDLSPDNLSIEDQAQEGSCVSNAMTTACERVKAEASGVKRQLSRQYHYYRGRAVDPFTAPPKDGGMTLKQGMQAAKAWGICLEQTWPYLAANMNTVPSPEADAEAGQHKLMEYRRIKGGYYDGDIAAVFRRIREALTLGYGVLVGMALEGSFFYLKGPCNGRPYNYAGMAKIGGVNVGGHCMSVDSYALRGALDYLGESNSWNTTWGDQGRALLASTVLCGSDSFDIWAIKTFDGTAAVDPMQQQADTFISRLYVAMFGRAPDAEGLAYWRGVYQQGSTLETIATQMYAVDPARAYYPSFLTNEQVAAAFYTSVLGRQPDADGLAYWTNQINALGAGPAIQRMAQVTANYVGSDTVACAASDRFNRRTRVARIYGEQGGDIAGAAGVLANVN